MIDLKFFLEALPLALVCALGNYLLLRLLYRRTIISKFDPVHIWLLILAFYMLFELLPLFVPASRVFWVCLTLLILYHLAASVPGSSGVNRSQFLAITPRVQIAFSVLVFLILVADLVVNTLMSPIPLLSKGGSYERYLLNHNSRVLTWASAGVFAVPITLFGLTDVTLVKWLNAASMFVEVMTGILSASKSSVFAIILLYFNYRFLLEVRGKKPSRTLRWVFAFAAVAIVIILPFYLTFVSVGTNPFEAMSLFIVRLAAGFDQLIYWSAAGVKPQGYGLSLLTIYFVPVLRALFGYNPRYNTGIDYLFIELLGFRDTKEGMFPNSNLVLEAVFTNGVWGGAVIVIFIGLLSFYIRRWVLRRPGLRLWHVMLFQIFVASPFFWLIDDQRCVVSVYVGLAIYGLFTMCVNLPLIVRSMRVKLY